MTTPATPAAAKPSGIYIRLADLIVAGGAILILLFSWAPLIGISGLGGDGGLGGRSLWSWLSPIGLFVILAVLALIGTAAVDTWWHREKQMAGLHRHHLQVGLALFVLVDLIGLTFADPTSGFLSPSYGGILDILFALVIAAGAILNHLNLLQNPIGVPSVSVTAPPHAPHVPHQPAAPASDATLPADQPPAS